MVDAHPATVGDRLIDALLAAGVDHVFGIPGDYSLQLNKRVEERMQFVGTLDEQGAGFAADASQLRLIEAIIPRHDVSPVLTRLTDALGQRARNDTERPQS